MEPKVGMVCYVPDLIDDGWVVEYHTDFDKTPLILETIENLSQTYMIYATERVLINGVDHEKHIVSVSPHEYENRIKN